MRKIKYIVIHCSAGFGNRRAIEQFWKKSLGWKTPGYHYLIDTDGTFHSLSGLETPTNGVKGHNANSIHICYIGGVDPQNVHHALDTRTPQQKAAMLTCIHQAISWTGKYQPVKGIKILGHRDFSPDTDGNSIIDAWERIKECPSFDAIPEFQMIKL